MKIFNLRHFLIVMLTRSNFKYNGMLKESTIVHHRHLVIFKFKTVIVIWIYILVLTEAWLYIIMTLGYLFIRISLRSKITWAGWTSDLRIGVVYINKVHRDRVKGGIESRDHVVIVICSIKSLNSTKTDSSWDTVGTANRWFFDTLWY